jgi:hypothetical protein
MDHVIFVLRYEEGVACFGRSWIPGMAKSSNYAVRFMSTKAHITIFSSV